MPAPVPPTTSTEDWYDGKPLGLGPRVPMTIVSPWTVGGHVCSEISDHTSVLRFLERWTGVAEPNISDWRRSVCGDLTSAFDFSGSGRAPALDQPGPIPAPIDRWHPTPPATQSLPAQEPGRRPARALPYRPWVSARLKGDELVLTLNNSGQASCHFTVYSYGGQQTNPLHVDVATRTELRFPSTDLTIQGPNRFWYELSGSIPVDVTFRNGTLDLVNYNDTTVTLRVHPLRYKGRTSTVRLRPNQHRSLSWVTDNGWYDLEVTAPGFRRRLTGRVEDGRPGTTA